MAGKVRARGEGCLGGTARLNFEEESFLPTLYLFILPALLLSLEYRGTHPGLGTKFPFFCSNMSWQDSAGTIPCTQTQSPGTQQVCEALSWDPVCSSPVAHIPMETTRSFPSVRTAVTSLPAADKPICHEVIKRHVLCLRELAPGFVPPEPELLTHPEGKQWPWGHTGEPLASPECHQNIEHHPKLNTSRGSTQHSTHRCVPTAQGCPWPAHTGTQPCVIPPAPRGHSSPVITWPAEPELQIRRVLGNPLLSKLLPVVISTGEVQGVLRLRDYPELVTPGSDLQGHKDV